MAMTRDLKERKTGRRRMSSAVVPERESMMTGSPGCRMPRSPCTASAAWRKIAGVPVLHSVAAIFWPIRPDLPTPQKHDLAGVRGQQVDGLRERAVEPRGELGERGGFSLEEGAGGVEGGGHVKTRVWSLEFRRREK